MKPIASTLKHSSSLTPKPSRVIAGLAFSFAGIGMAQNANALGDPNEFITQIGSQNSYLTSPKTLVTDQNTSKVAILSHNVDVLADESWRINQQAGDVMLVRVKGNPTQILGNVTADANLILTNGAGVFFGSGAHVNVGSLIVSTADISNDNFKKGRYVFDGRGNRNATITNKGTITAKEGGLVALLAPGVANDGVISAQSGNVALGSGNAFTLDFYGDKLYSFSVDEKADAGGGIKNTGTINAQGGTVYMTARAAKDVVDQAINTTGIIDASSAHMDGGVVVLDGGDGAVNVAGTVKASGKKGGTITVVGDSINVAENTVIDASGKTGGGVVDIGGKDTANRAQVVRVAKSALIDASTVTGKAGKVTVWSDKQTAFHGTIDITSQQGHGGEAEVSSKDQLAYDGLTKAKGATGYGSLLLDPGDMTISNDPDSTAAGGSGGGFNNMNTSTLTQALENADVTINTQTLNNSTLSDPGDITVRDGFTWDNATTLTLTASNNLYVTGAAVKGTTGNITVNAHDVILTGGGSLTAGPLTFDPASANRITGGGQLTINNTGKFSTDTENVLNGGTITVNQSTDGSIQNVVDAIGNVGKLDLIDEYMGQLGHGGAFINLGDGNWNEKVTINKDNIALIGSGNSTVSAAGDAVVAVNGASNVSVKNLNIDASQNPSMTGISATNTGLIRVEGNTTTGGATGIDFSNVNSGSGDHYSLIAGNTINQATTAIKVENNSQFILVSGNTATNISGTAIEADGSNNTTISTNTITGANKGIVITDGTGHRVDGNTLTGITDTGIEATGVNDTSITRNNITMAGNAKYGIRLFDATASSVGNTRTSTGLGNTIKGGTAGISVDGSISYMASFSPDDPTGTVTTTSVYDSNDVTVAGNTIDSMRYGVDVGKVKNVAVNNNVIGDIGLGNSYSRLTGSAIHVDGADTVAIKGNTVSFVDPYAYYYSKNGIDVSNTHSFDIAGNTLSQTAYPGQGISLAYYGIVLANNTGTNNVGNGTTAGENTITNFYTGIRADGTPVRIDTNTINYNDPNVGASAIGIGTTGDVTINNNRINLATGFSYGIEAFDGKAAVTNNNVTASMFGIYINNANGSTISGNTVYAPGNRTDNAGIVVLRSNDVTVGGLTPDKGNKVSGYSEGIISYVNSLNSKILNNDVNASLFGIMLHSGANNALVDSNRVTTGGHAIIVSSIDGATITNNVLTSTNGRGTAIAASTVIPSVYQGAVIGTASSNLTIGTADAGNSIYGFNKGIEVKGSISNVGGNTIFASHDVSIAGNKIDNVYSTAITADTVKNLTISDNQIGQRGTEEIMAMHHLSTLDERHIASGIYVANSNTVAIKRNTLTGYINEQIGAAREGISLSNVENATVGDDTNGNTVTGYLVGIAARNSSGSVQGNTVRDGVDNNNFNATINQTLYGIDVEGYGGSRIMTVDNNDVTMRSYFNNGIISDGNTSITNNRVTAYHGIVATGNNVDISGNTIAASKFNDGKGIWVYNGNTVTMDHNNISNFYYGMQIDGYEHHDTASNNTLTGNTYGIVVFNGQYENGPGIKPHDIDLVNNTIVGNGNSVGIWVNADDVHISGGTISSNATGLDLVDSPRLTIHDVVMSDNGKHLNVRNGSTVTAGGLTVNGGNVGVQVDGADSNFAFSDNNSSFTNVGKYVVLQNGALNGLVLDASGQTFDGTNAKNFTLAKYNAARGKTTDTETVDALNGGITTVGFVNYGAVPGADLSFLNALNSALRNNDGSPFIPGMSLANRVNPGLPDNRFTPSQADLGLGGGTAPTGGTGTNFGNLSPAANGPDSTKNADASAYANLDPAAGPQQDDCGNGFLGGGGDLGYNSSNCSTKQSN